MARSGFVEVAAGLAAVAVSFVRAPTPRAAPPPVPIAWATDVPGLPRPFVPIPSVDAPEEPEPERPRPPAPTPQPPPPPPPVRVGDRFNFGPILNGYRATVGLHPLVHDPNLDAWSRLNNEACNAAYRGGCPSSPTGLHLKINPYAWQNAGFGYTGPAHVGEGWWGSPPHQKAMLQRNITRYGIEWGPGPYWTLNML